jgi:guanosine-diphosphatase
VAYEYEDFKNLQPGLLYRKVSPQQAAEGLGELMDGAVRTVPKNLRKCTPVVVKATTGLKSLDETWSEVIMDMVASRLREKYEFYFRSNEDVAIMNGKEGFFAWITTNYFLHTTGGYIIPPGNQRVPEKKSTFAVLDLGGRSTQMGFEPAFDEKRPDSTLKDGEHKCDLTFGGESRVLHQRSYLGSG